MPYPIVFPGSYGNKNVSQPGSIDEQRMVWTSPDGSYTIDLNTLPKDVYNDWVTTAQRMFRGVYNSDASNIDAYLNYMAYANRAVYDQYLTQYGKASTVDAISSAQPKMTPEEQMNAQPTFMVPPMQENYMSLTTEGAPAFDKNKYETDLKSWQDNLRRQGFNPDTYDAKTQTINTTSGFKTGIFTQPNGTFKILSGSAAQDERQRQAQTPVVNATEQEDLMNRVKVITGLDPSAIGRPETKQNEDGSYSIVFKNPEQLAWYTGVVTEQAKVRTDLLPRVGYTNDPAIREQRRQEAAAAQQAKVDLNSLMASPTTKFQLGDFTVKR